MNIFDYQAPPDLLKERIILITGAGTGIGKAAAQTFAAHGATVVLLGRNMHDLEAVYDAIEAADSPQPAIYPMNLEGASPKDYEDLTTILENEFGRLDGLLHNAAELGTLTPLEQYELETWAKVMQVNLHAPYLLTRACLPLLCRSRGASILFTTADVARRGRAYWGAYSIAYAGVENMMQILSHELEENTCIRVNSIDPGVVRTGMRAEAYPGEDPNTVVKPGTIMPAYLYLMGNDSEEVNGQALCAQRQE